SDSRGERPFGVGNKIRRHGGDAADVERANRVRRIRNADRLASDVQQTGILDLKRIHQSAARHVTKPAKVGAKISSREDGVVDCAAQSKSIVEGNASSNAAICGGVPVEDSGVTGRMQSYNRQTPDSNRKREAKTLHIH